MPIIHQRMTYIAPYNHTLFTSAYIKYFLKFKALRKKMPGPMNGDFFLEVFMVCCFRKPPMNA